MKIRYKNLCVLLIAFLVLQGCTDNRSGTNPSPAQPPSSTSVSTTSSSYPASTDQESISQSYPNPEPIIDDEPVVVEAIEIPLDLPAPESGYGTIGGVIVNEGTNQPPPESLLYIAPLLYTDQGLPIVSLDRQNDPVAVLPPQGLFVFENIEPGEYSLVFFTPDYSFLIEDQSSGDSLILTVSPNQVIDLGLIELQN
jgi:hypothetical protein